MRRSSTLLTNLRVPGTRRYSESEGAESSLSGHRLPLSPVSRTLTHPFTSPATQEYDVLYENQRGFYIIGIPKFSANLLYPLDPPAWCDRFGKGVSTDIQTYSLPDPTWEWVTDNWLVDMSGDVDPNGWQYAFRFRQHTWRGDPKTFHNFVRRRRWIRLRRKKTNSERIIGVYGAATQVSEPHPLTPTSINSLPSSDSASIEPLSTEQEPSELTQLLILSRVDREKLAIIQKEIYHRKFPFTEEETDEIINCMEYESTRKRLRKLLADHAAECATLLDRSAQATDPPSTEFVSFPSQLDLTCSQHNDFTSGTKLSVYSDANSHLE